MGGRLKQTVLWDIGGLENNVVCCRSIDVLGRSSMVTLWSCDDFSGLRECIWGDDVLLEN